MEDREMARSLRAEGLSYSEIASVVGRSQTTVVDWVKDIVLSEEQKKFLLGKRRKPELKEQARELRRAGKSVKGIAKEIGAAPSSVSMWVRDLPLTDEQRDGLGRQLRRPDGSIDGEACEKLARINTSRRLERWENARREAEKQWPGLSSDHDFMLGLGLYIGEGDKQSDSSVIISNCDPVVMRLGIRFLRCIGVPDEQFNPNINLNAIIEDNAKSAVEFWSREIGIPIGRFKKTAFDRRGGKGKSKRNPWPNGCCHIRVHDTTLKQKVKRWMELALQI